MCNITQIELQNFQNIVSIVGDGNMKLAKALAHNGNNKFKDLLGLIENNSDMVKELKKQI